MCLLTETAQELGNKKQVYRDKDMLKIIILFFDYFSFYYVRCRIIDNISELYDNLKEFFSSLGTIIGTSIIFILCILFLPFFIFKYLYKAIRFVYLTKYVPINEENYNYLLNLQDIDHKNVNRIYKYVNNLIDNDREKKE